MPRHSPGTNQHRRFHQAPARLVQPAHLVRCPQRPPRSALCQRCSGATCPKSATAGSPAPARPAPESLPTAPQPLVGQFVVLLTEPASALGTSTGDFEAFLQPLRILNRLCFDAQQVAVRLASKSPMSMRSRSGPEDALLMAAAAVPPARACRTRGVRPSWGSCQVK